MTKKTINIDLQVERGDFTRLTTALFEGNPPEGTNLIPVGKESTGPWSADLDPGTYTFEVRILAPVGTVLTVIVTCGGSSRSFSFTLPGDSGAYVDWVQNFAFTIAEDGSVS